MYNSFKVNINPADRRALGKNNTYLQYLSNFLDPHFGHLDMPVTYSLQLLLFQEYPHLRHFIQRSPTSFFLVQYPD